MAGPAPGRPLARLAVVALTAALALAGAAPLLAAAPDRVEPQPASGPTRVLPWTGGDRLAVRIDADVRYVQGADAKVTISGPRDLIDDIVVEDGVIRYDEGIWWWTPWWWWRPDGHVEIVLTAPRLSAARLGGSGRLALGQLAQDQLELIVSGSGRATASGAIRSLTVRVSGSGEARVTELSAAEMTATISGSGGLTASGVAGALRLRVSGSGGADLAALALDTVEATLSGSGSARLAPKRSADLLVSGSGSIRLLTEPARLTTHRSGSGRIIRAKDGG